MKNIVENYVIQCYDEQTEPEAETGRRAGISGPRLLSASPENISEKGMNQEMERIRASDSGVRLNRTLAVLYWTVFAAVAALLLWRCRYGFAKMDEAFFLTVPLRFVRGDRMLLNEWHMSQFSFFTMVPSMWLYLKIAKTTEGIVLAFRYIFTVLWCAAALFLYFRTRKINVHGARCASLFLQAYAPFGIMAFSYNSLAILYLMNAAVFLLCAERHKKLQFTVSGVFFAGAVLCCPYLAAAYILYSAVLGAAKLRKRNPVIPLNGTDVRTCWKYFTLGVCILAVLFLFFLFMQIPLEKLPDSLAGALSDPQHASFSPAYKTAEYFGRIAGSNGYFYLMLITVVLMTALSLYKRRAVWFSVVCAAVVLYLRRFMQEYGYLNFLMFPLTFAGLYVLAVTKDSRIRWTGALCLLPGLLYTYCLNYSSNQFFYAISSAASVSSLASIYMMWMYCGELKGESKAREKGRNAYVLAYAAAAVCLLFQLKYEIPVRYESVYWEPGLIRYEEQEEITEGPEKGIIAIAENAESYAHLYGDIRNIHGKKVLYFSEQIWMYLVNDNEMATYSGWISFLNEYSLSRMREYYRICPEKKPDVIFLEGEYSQFLDCFDLAEFMVEQTPGGNYLIRYRETA